MPRDTKALLFDLGRFRSTDGPGIRTILFFKGCPLRCRWCSNPFGLSSEVQLSVNAARCTGCARCVAACPWGANRVENGRVQVDFAACQHCGDCLEGCAGECRSLLGQQYSLPQLFAEIQKDAAFYRRGGGGVTLSGGEPLAQPKAAISLLRLCKAHYLDTCLETSAYCAWETLREAALLCNTVFIDLKHADAARHQQLTGVTNERILQNIKTLASDTAAGSCRLIVRIPLIPACNDEDENMIASARFLAALPRAVEVNLLPYHSLGSTKYEMLGLPLPALPQEPFTAKSPRVLHCASLLAQHAPACPLSIGGDAIFSKP